MSYTAADVANLRKLTSAGMMDCKNALAESDGDMEKAKEWLRKKGLAGAAKRAGRAADQGTVDVVLDGNVAALVEVNCETDFVAKGELFTGFVADLASLVAKQGSDDLENQPFGESTVAGEITALGAKVGENVTLGRSERYETNGVVDAYKHLQAGRGFIGVLVELTGAADSEQAREVAHDIALHIASAAPRYVTRDEVPAEIVEKERAVFEEITRNEGKPEAAIPKIIEGRLGGFYKETVLLEQPFVKDNKQTINDIVKTLGADATVSRFTRIKIGEE
ncbi:MAG: translation elongation factor Ts [Acidimicrobiia bacterium]